MKWDWKGPGSRLGPPLLPEQLESVQASPHSSLLHSTSSSCSYSSPPIVFPPTMRGGSTGPLGHLQEGM